MNECMDATRTGSRAQRQACKGAVAGDGDVPRWTQKRSKSVRQVLKGWVRLLAATSWT